MKKIIVNEYLIQYRIIEKLDRVTYFTSAYLYHDDNEGILIDTGLYDMGQYIRADVEKMGIDLKYIVISHYHKDHAQGAIAFDTPIIGSDMFETNYEKCQSVSKYNYRQPDILVHDKASYQIGQSKVEVFKTPGHTPCGLSVLINDTYLYVSDNLLEDIDNRIIIPYLDVTANPVDHYKTILLYDQLRPDHLLFTHGPIKFNADLNYEFSERLYYLETLIRNNYDVDLSECLIGDVENYSMTAIHKINMRNGKKYALEHDTSLFDS